MPYDFWKTRWDAGQIGFHEGRPNALLVAHADRLPPNARVLVPLAGKAVDLAWLAARGHAVVGVEFVMPAIEGFFRERGLDMADHQTKLGKHDGWSASGVTMICADMLTVSPDDLGRFDAVYDRGALVALEPNVRARYVDVCRALLRDGGTTFLIAIEYDGNTTVGPPWSLDERAVRALFAEETVDRIASAASAASPRLAAAGVTSVRDTAYAIRHR